MEAPGVDLKLAVGNDVEPISDIAGPDDELASRNRNREERSREALLHSDRKRREHRHLIDQLELGGRGDRSIYLHEPAIRREGQKRQDRSEERRVGKEWG